MSTSPSLVDTSALTPAQRRGLTRAGQALVPGGDGLPPFRETSAIASADRMLRYLPEADRKSFASLMGLFNFVPVYLIRLLLRVADAHRFFPGPVGAGLRLLRFGVFG